MNNRTWGKGIARLATAVSAMALLSACAVQPDPISKEEFAARAIERQKEIVKDLAAIDRPLTLADAVARAVTYNLDARVRMMEEAQALGQLDVARWDLLPKLAANAGYKSRSEFNSTRSRNLYTQTNSDAEPTYSTERDNYTGDLTLTWNVLDFGVGYFNAKSQADRALIAAERRRKSLHTLIQDVRAAWWRAASAEKLRDDVAKTLTEAEQALGQWRQAEKANVANPIDTLRNERSLIDSIRQLETVDQELSTAKTELAVLMGMPPGSNFTVAVPAEDAMTAPEWTMPVERMETIALTNNPDLHETAYLKRISVQDTRKAILRMLPGLSFSAGRQYDSNTFMLANRWWEAGAKVSWNLLSVFQGPDEIKAARQGEDLAEQRALAMHMAVLSQAHIALRQFDIAVKQFERASQIHEIDKRILGHSVAREAADAQGELERISNSTTMILGLLRRYQTLAQVHAALGRIQATLGVDPVPQAVAKRDVNLLAERIAEHLSKLEGGSGEIAPDAPVEAPAVADPAPTQPQPVAITAQPVVAMAPEPAPMEKLWADVHKMLSMSEMMTADPAAAGK